MLEKTILVVLIILIVLSIPTQISEAQNSEMERKVVNVTLIEPEPTIEPLDVPTVTQPQFVSLGEFKITAYCACIECCGKTDGITATGTRATQGRTIAVYPKQIPYGTEVTFDGHTYIAEDCGGAIKENRIDVYFDSHQDALEYGVQYHEVFVLVESEE